MSPRWLWKVHRNRRSKRHKKSWLQWERGRQWSDRNEVDFFPRGTGCRARLLYLGILTDAGSKEEKKYEKKVQDFVRSDSPHGVADMHDRSRRGAGFSVRTGKPEPGTGAADGQAYNSGSYAADAGRAG